MTEFEPQLCATNILNRRFQWLAAGQADRALAAGQANRPLVVLLHGFPDTAEVWRSWVAGLAAQFEVCAPFLPMAPDVSNERFQIDSLVFDYLTFLQPAIAAGREIHLVGHDVGVALGFRLAEKLGAAVQSFTAINGLSLEQFRARLNQPRQLMRSWYMAALQVPGLAPVAFANQRPLFQKLFSRLAGTTSTTADGTGSYPLYGKWMRTALREWRKRPAKLSARLLVLWSAQDPFLQPTTWDEFAPLADDVSIRILEGTHWVHLDESKKVMPLVRDFIADAPNFAKGRA